MNKQYTYLGMATSAHRWDAYGARIEPSNRRYEVRGMVSDNILGYVHADDIDTAYEKALTQYVTVFYLIAVGNPSHGRSL